MGFHTENKDFTQFFILDQSEKRLWQLGLAADVLREAVSWLSSCSTSSTGCLCSSTVFFYLAALSWPEADPSFPSSRNVLAARRHPPQMQRQRRSAASLRPSGRSRQTVSS